MNPTVKLRNLTLGEGIPKICVPIVGRTAREVLAAARSIMAHKPDMIEWRIDYLPDIVRMCGKAKESGQDEAEIAATGRELRKILGDTPLLVTFRTKREGGEQDILPEEYTAVYKTVLESGFADAVDVELLMGEEILSRLMARAHGAGAKVIVSRHDFQKTPAKEAMLRTLQEMAAAGADVAKIAVMPRSRADVLALLEATQSASQALQTTPVITMAMGGQGMVSRLLGETFGSCLTFAMVGEASAPGQIPIEHLRTVLDTIHRYSG